MLTTRIDFGDYHISLGRATRLSALMARVYQRHFCERTPALRDLFEETHATIESRLEEIRKTDETLADYYELAQAFISVASFVQEADGFPFRWPKVGELPGPDLIDEMFRCYLLEQELEDSIWHKMMTALVELFVPLAPPELQPPSVVGERAKLEETDPNLPALAETPSNGSSGKLSDPLPSVESLPGGGSA